MSRRRPFGVSVLVVLVWLQALLEIAGGVLLLLFRDDKEVLANTDFSTDALLTIAIVLLIAGVITALVASALGNGSNFARWLVAILSLFNLAGGIVQVAAVHGNNVASGISSIVIALIVLYILFAERGSREFFTGR